MFDYLYIAPYEESSKFMNRLMLAASFTVGGGGNAHKGMSLVVKNLVTKQDQPDRDSYGHKDKIDPRITIKDIGGGGAY